MDQTIVWARGNGLPNEPDCVVDAPEFHRETDGPATYVISLWIIHKNLFQFLKGPKFSVGCLSGLPA